MKKFVSFLVAFILSMPVFGQYETVIYDYEKNYFNQGQPLPAESYFMLNAPVRPDVQLLEFEIHRPGKSRFAPLYQTSWKRSFSNNSSNVELPVNFQLHGNDEYDLVIKTYRRVSDVERENLKKSLFMTTDAYVKSVLESGNRKAFISKPTGQILNDLNDIIKQGTSYYRNKIDLEFTGFSDIINNKLRQINEIKKTRRVFGKRVKGETEEKMLNYQVAELIDATHVELEQFLNTELLVLEDTKRILEYKTEKTRSYISLNAGYGGAYFDGDYNDLNYGAAPYLGISVPFGKASFSKTFWSNSSLSFGAFIKNFEDKEDKTVTGPIFKRPVYLAYGYKIFRFIRLNAGATLVEFEKLNASDKFGQVRVKPFVGISAEINFWMGLGRH